MACKTQSVDLQNRAVVQTKATANLDTYPASTPLPFRLPEQNVSASQISLDRTPIRCSEIYQQAVIAVMETSREAQEASGTDMEEIALGVMIEAEDMLDTIIDAHVARECAKAVRFALDAYKKAHEAR